MFKLFKNLFTRRSRRDETLTKKVGRTVAATQLPPGTPSSPPPVSEDEANSTLNTQNSTFPDPPTARNGKIAKLPRHLRDHINRAFDSGQSAVSIAEQLNKLPKVKAILDTHFEGRPIRHQNLSEWKAGGYRDWQLRQELLYKQQELAADAQEMAKIAHGMDDSLFGMALLDYARLMKNADKDSPEEFEKKRKVLSNMINDIVRLRRCQNQTRGVEVQEEHLERDREKTSEEIFLKFMEWASNPEIRRTFILEPMVAMALQRRHFGLPPRPEDAKALKEYGYSDPAKTNENQEVPADFPPPPTKNPEARSSRGDEALTKEEPPDNSSASTLQPCNVSTPPNILDARGNTQHASISSIRPIPASPPPTSETVSPQSSNQSTGPAAVPSLGGEGKGEGEIPFAKGADPAASTSPSSSTLNPQPAAPVASRESAAIQPATCNIQPSSAPKPPVTHTLDEFSAQIDAALRPSPEILEKRKRQHEESLRQAEGNRQIRLIQIQYGIKPSSPFAS